MKTWFIAPIILFLILLAFSCNRSVGDVTHYQPPCERDQTGTVCFHNATRKEVKIKVADTKTEVAARTTRCFDLYSGHYEYKARQGWHKWTNTLQVESCQSNYVCLE